VLRASRHLRLKLCGSRRHPTIGQTRPIAAGASQQFGSAASELPVLRRADQRLPGPITHRLMLATMRMRSTSHPVRKRSPHPLSQPIARSLRSRIAEPHFDRQRSPRKPLVNPIPILIVPRRGHHPATCFRSSAGVPDLCIASGSPTESKTCRSNSCPGTNPQGNTKHGQPGPATHRASGPDSEA